MGTADKGLICDVNGSGVGLIDYDNDGWLDIYLVNGSNFDALDGKQEPPHASLFHNNHDGTFTNVAVKAGVTNDRWGFGVAVADYDNDGWPDIFVANLGKNRLYHNNHDGTFTDVAEKAGITLGNWSAGGTWGDYDGDGRLDLFVTGYVHFDRNNLPYEKTKAVGYSYCEFRGEPVMCGPKNIEGEPDHLFHNNGDGTFTDMSVKAGVSDETNRYYGFTPVFVDVNNDGKVDLVVADDSTLSYLYLNSGDGTFEDASYASGFGLNEDGHEVAAMGVAVGDYLNNGLVDFAISDFSDEAKLIFHNDGKASFTEVSMRTGIGKVSMPFLGWGTGFVDYDNDGWLDLMFVNGHIYPAADRLDWGTSYSQRPLLFRNTRDGKFEEVPPVKGTGLAQIISGRGAAFGDLFNNGKIDVVINQVEGPPVLLKNVYPDHHHWVELKLMGGPKSPRDAVGATVYLSGSGIRQRRDVISGGSYVSTNDPRVHFGLGDSAGAVSTEIHWPSGTDRDGEVARSRSHLHRHRRPRRYRRTMRRHHLPDYAGCRLARHFTERALMWLSSHLRALLGAVWLAASTQRRRNLRRRARRIRRRLRRPQTMVPGKFVDITQKVGVHFQHQALHTTSQISARNHGFRSSAV